MTETLIWYAPLVFLMAGTVKGGLGIGLPTTVIALLSLLVDPRLSVALGLAAMILTNAWQVHREGGWRGPFRRFWLLSLVTGVTLFVVSQLAAEADGDFVLALTGVSVSIFAATSLIGRPPALPPRWERGAQVAAGLVAGGMGGVTGIWSPPILMLLLALRLDRSEFVRSIGLLLLLGALPLLFGYATAGLMTWPVFGASLLLCIPVFIGFSIGERVRRAMDPAKFQTVFLVFFLIMGLNMIRQSVLGG